jgi:hypothetical protein
LERKGDDGFHQSGVRSQSIWVCTDGSITHADDSTHAAGNARIMGRHQQRGAFADDFVKTVQHGLSRGGIKTARRFVSENKRWPIDQCPSGGNPLRFAE